MISLQFLTSLLGEGRKLSKANEYIFYCPVCHHKKRKLQVNVDKEFFHCWICSVSCRSLHSFVKAYFPHRLDSVRSNKKSDKKNNLSQYAEFESDFQDDEEQELCLPKDTLCIKDVTLKQIKSIPGLKNAVLYLKNRGITSKHIIKYNLGVCGYNSGRIRIVIPSYGSDNTLNYFVTRLVVEEQGRPKYYNSPLDHHTVIPLESHIQWNHSITLTEGMFDAIKIDYNAIPLLGKNISTDWAVFKKIINFNKIVYLALDNDKYGLEATIDIAEKLLFYNIECKFVDLAPFKDAGSMSKRDYLLKRRDAISINEFWIMNKKVECVD